MKEPLVSNAGDRKQVEEAKGAEKRARERELNDLRSVLSTPQGRRLYWRVLKYCKALPTAQDAAEASIWHASALIHYRSGAQDVGNHLTLEAKAAGGYGILDQMERENEGDHAV